MFKSLRRGFIRMNMLVISLMMLAAFAVVYLLFYSNTQAELKSELQMLLSMNDEVGGFAPPRQWEGQPPRQEAPLPEEEPPKEVEGFTRIGFSVRVGEDGYELAQPQFFFVAEEFDIEAMLQQVTAAGSGHGSFALDGRYWNFQTRQDAGGALVVAFVESSESRALLGNLVKIFLVVAVVLLAAIWFVSRWFARRSVAPIEEAYNNQRRFVQDASHELKTPVAVIKTNLELMAAHPKERVEQQQEWMDNMAAETAHMERLTSSLLALARADTEQPRNAQEELALSDVVQGCVLPLEAVLYEKGLHFENRVQEGIKTLGSRDDMERLVHILMENAVQYTPKDGSIALALWAEKRRAVLQVRNTGEGIPEKDLPHVFERFYRGDAARSRQENSYGLGLSIAQGIVQRHGGTIAAKSEQGESATFTVKLPLLK